MARFLPILFILLFATHSVLNAADTVALSTPSQSPQPFWRTKEKVLTKIVEEKAIIVSVNATEMKAEKKPLNQLSMVGGGLVKLSFETAFERAQKYEDLKRVSDHIREVKWQPANKELYVHTEAFRYHARMRMKVSTDTSEENMRRIRFEVIDGNFKGMRGEFSFENYKSGKTLMGFSSLYEYKKLPMPTFFVEFGLEVVLQKVASLMRQHLENP